MQEKMEYFNMDNPVDKAFIDGGYHSGDRICQMIILPYPEIEFEEAEELSVTDRGKGGYGSTGR